MSEHNPFEGLEEGQVGAENLYLQEVGRARSTDQTPQPEPRVRVSQPQREERVRHSPEQNRPRIARALIDPFAAQQEQAGNIDELLAAPRTAPQPQRVPMIDSQKLIQRRAAQLQQFRPETNAEMMLHMALQDNVAIVQTLRAMQVQMNQPREQSLWERHPWLLPIVQIAATTILVLAGVRFML